MQSCNQGEDFIQCNYTSVQWFRLPLTAVGTAMLYVLYCAWVPFLLEGLLSIAKNMHAIWHLHMHADVHSIGWASSQTLWFLFHHLADVVRAHTNVHVHTTENYAHHIVSTVSTACRWSPESHQMSTAIHVAPLEQIRTEDTSQAEGSHDSAQICPGERGTPLAQSTPGSEQAVTT